MIPYRLSLPVLVTALLAHPAVGASAQTPTPQPAASGQPAAGQINFSGVLYTNFQYRTDPAARHFNKFDVERAYLTFRMPAGERASVRVTADVFQQTASPNDAYYRGWAVRLKYGYLQYDYLRRGDAGALARIGMLHTVVIDHEEQFWPRWIAQTVLDRTGVFSSADLGAATQITLPGKIGEVYATITNGAGYTARETDRFKDYAVRLSITPLAGSGVTLLRTLALSPWVSRGATASRFAAGGPGQLGPVGDGLRKDRWGVFAGVRDPRFTAGVHFASRIEEGENGDNTISSPRVVTDSTGRVLSAYALLKPGAFADTAGTLPLGLVLRWDRVDVNRSVGSRYHFLVAGVTWDLNRRVSLALDYQEQLPDRGSSIAPLKTYFAHFVAAF